MFQHRRRIDDRPQARVGAVMSTPWTPERDAELRVLWERGDTCSEIGRALKTTKSAITGRVHRLKLPPRPSPLKARSTNVKPAPKPTGARLTQWRRAGTTTPPMKIPEHPVVLADLKKGVGGSRRHCQFIPGDPAGEHTLYCGDMPYENSPYCPRHMLVCYTPRPANKKVLTHE